MSNADKNFIEESKKEDIRKVCRYIITASIVLFVGYLIFYFISDDFPLWPLFVLPGITIASLIYHESNLSYEEVLSRKNIAEKNSKMFSAGKYISGHPELNEPLDEAYLMPEKEELVIYSVNNKTGQRDFKSSIEKDAITNIIVENESQVRRRVSVAHLALIGLFAFATKKKVVDELAYIVIEWKKGKFEHETMFEFKQKGALQNANTLRNKIIKVVSVASGRVQKSDPKKPKGDYLP